MTEVRLAHLNDAAAINTLTAVLGYAATLDQTTTWLAELVESLQHAVYVAEREQQVYGWLVVERRLSLESGYKAQITGLVVAEEAQRCGLGQQLVAAAKEWARQQGLTSLTVSSNIQRDGSHRFYQALGFKLCKTSHFYQHLFQD